MDTNHCLTLGEKLRLVRQAKGFSQTNVADAVKCHVVDISHIERGENKISSEMLASIKQFLEITNAPLMEDAYIKAQRINDKFYIERALGDLAFINLKMGNYEKALGQFEQAIPMSKGVMKNEVELACYCGTARCLLMLKRYDECVEIIKKGKSMTDINDRNYIALEAVN